MRFFFFPSTRSISGLSTSSIGFGSGFFLVYLFPDGARLSPVKSHFSEKISMESPGQMLQPNLFDLCLPSEIKIY